MDNEVIQANYEELEAIAVRFGRRAEAQEELNGRIIRAMQALRRGGWQGEAAESFFAEMDEQLLPAMRRLQEALLEAQATTRMIQEIIRQAEEEAAARFGGGAAEGIAGEAGLVGDPGPGAGPAPADLTAPVRDVGGLFGDAYMDGMVGSRIRGEDSAALNRAMWTLAQNPSGGELDSALAQIAAARGVPVSELRAQYDKFQALQDAAAAQAGRDPDLPSVTALNATFHGDFMGSTAQLRYGKVVGDAFGLDPVFGAMLNPTGGMVGPDNLSVNPADDSPLGYHGIFHDAGGYLYKYHDLGPGYDYLGEETARDPGNPLTGQQSGIRHWYEKLAPGPVTDTILDSGDYVIDTGEEVIESVDAGIDYVRDLDDRAVDFFGKAAREAEEAFEFAF